MFMNVYFISCLQQFYLTEIMPNQVILRREGAELRHFLDCICHHAPDSEVFPTFYADYWE